MNHFICIACGTQFAASSTPPAHCPICEDERQYVNPGGQRWTTLDQLRSSHRNSIQQLESGLTGIGTEPCFAIGQRALLIQTQEGNILWDCISLIDDATVQFIQGLGGLRAIAISHPHYYTTLVEWRRAFGQVPVYLHAADKEWVMRSDSCIQFWEGDTCSIGTGVTLIHCGGHFAGGTVLHWQDGAQGQGVLLSGDIIQVVADQQHVSFMYSYPNLIPLSVATIQGITDAVQPFSYERIYGAWWGHNILTHGHDVVTRSAKRYQSMLEHRTPEK